MSSSKNNPLNRGQKKVTMYNGKPVKPILFIGEDSRYMAAAYEDGKLVMDPRTNAPIAFANVG